MGWSINQIEAEFLQGKIGGLSPPPEVIIGSFERVERLLGRGWIDSVVGKGIAPTLHIVGMGLRLACLEGIAGSERLVECIRRKDRDAEAELTAIYLIRSTCPFVPFELYPTAGRRKADFRVRGEADEHWTTIEVTRPNVSREHKRVQSLLQHVSQALVRSEIQFSLDILFRREPTQAEIATLRDHLSQFCNLEGQHQAELKAQLGTMLLNKTPLGQVIKWTFVDRGDAPIMGLLHIVIRGGKPHQQISVSLPFTDERARKILRDEARQLPKGGMGLVMVDVGNVIGSFQDWEATLCRSFHLAQHTRVSGVCLFEGSPAPTEAGYNWLLHTKLVTNDHARFQLPGWIQAAVASAGREYELVSSKW